MERIEREGVPLGEILSEGSVKSGRGYQVEGGKLKPVPDEMARLPSLWKTPEYNPARLADLHRPSLAERGLHELWRKRDMAIYRGPLLILPKSAHKLALETGRTSAAYHEGDLTFSENFYGFSFAAAAPGFATVLCALLNSAVPGYQLLFGAGALGMERPSVPIQDVRALSFPRFTVTERMAEQAAAALACAREDGCKALDAFAGRLWGLAPHERELVRDGIRRGMSTFLDSTPARRRDVEPPDLDTLLRYANATCRTVNAVLRFSGRRHLRAVVARRRAVSDDLLDRFLAVRFFTCEGRPSNGVELAQVKDQTEHAYEGLRKHLVRAPTPYLRERRSLRIYDGPSVTFVKPAQNRYWTVADAMRDGDVILADHAPGGEP